MDLKEARAVLREWAKSPAESAWGKSPLELLEAAEVIEDHLDALTEAVKPLKEQLERLQLALDLEEDDSPPVTAPECKPVDPADWDRYISNLPKVPVTDGIGGPVVGSATLLAEGGNVFASMEVSKDFKEKLDRRLQARIVP
jgi:hypothetical protein